MSSNIKGVGGGSGSRSWFWSDCCTVPSLCIKLHCLECYVLKNEIQIVTGGSHPWISKALFFIAVHHVFCMCKGIAIGFFRISFISYFALFYIEEAVSWPQRNIVHSPPTKQSRGQVAENQSITEEGLKWVFYIVVSL